jgi:DNA repair exonuclease SbcCD ATPase subunit
VKPEQIEKRLTWIDEQRRKNSDFVVGLKEQLTNALHLIENQEKQIKELTSEVARLSAQTSRIKQFDDDLIKQREDFSRHLAELIEGQSERDRRHESIRVIEHKEISRSISELRIEIEALEEIKSSLEVRRQEEIRIYSQIDEIEKTIERIGSIDEDTKRSLSMIDEARKMDSKRVADLQVETTDLRKRVDTLRGTLDAVEDRSKKFVTNFTELASNEVERNESQKLWIEKQELRLVGFEKDWKTWNTAFAEFQKKAEQVDEKMLKYDENYRAMRRARSDLDKMVDKLERRISEIGEIQRIAEDRLKSDWSAYLADDQKRWNTFKLNYDEQWREHERIHDKIQNELREHYENISDTTHSLSKLAEKSQARVMDLLTLVQDWAAEVESRLSEIK